MGVRGRFSDALNTDEYYYDNNGNLTSVDKTSYDAEGLCETETLTYGYDAFNRLISYSDGTTVASYTYNADNLRASKTVDNTRTDFVWNGQNLAAESIGNTINTYTYDITGVHIANQGGTVSAYYKDYHGNVIGRVDTDGEMIGERLTNPDYDAFGNQLKSTFTTAPFGYCGEYYDSESGLIYLRNRYYDSEIGRFINEDPIRDGTNWYVYCENNPVSLYDYSGLKAQGELIKIDSNNWFDIKSIQSKLNSLGYTGQDGKRLSVDGAFGANTDYAVRAYQREHGLSVDGIVGDATWSSMGFYMSSLPKTGSPNSKQTLYDNDGNKKQVREYGEDGQAVKDTDYKHGGNHVFPHEHVWSDGERGPAQPVSKPDNFEVDVAAGVITLLGVVAGCVYFFYTGSPDMVYQIVQ